MTEQEWLACENPREMVLWAHRSNGNTASRNFEITDRQYRMYACACWLFVEPSSVEAVNHFEERGFDVDDWYDDRSWGFSWTEGRQGRPPMRVRADLLRCILGNPFKKITKSGHEIYYGDGTHGQDSFITPTVKSIAQRIYDDRDWDVMSVLADALEDAGCPDKLLCVRCKGKTYISSRTPDDVGFGRSTVTLNCPDCKGTGHIVNSILDHLRGSVCQICEGKWFNVCSACMGSGRKLNRHARGCHVLDLILGKE